MNEDIKKNLGMRIRQLRKLRGHTQEVLDEKSGVSYKFIGEIERGEVNPSLDSLASIAAALNVGIKSLFPDDEDAIAHLSANEIILVKEVVGLLYRKLYTDQVSSK